ncbi:cation transporter [Flavobacterium cutihirudinis]
MSGMTCASCEKHVNHKVNKLAGILIIYKFEV